MSLSDKERMEINRLRAREVRKRKKINEEKMRQQIVELILDNNKIRVHMKIQQDEIRRLRRITQCKQQRTFLRDSSPSMTLDHILRCTKHHEQQGAFSRNPSPSRVILNQILRSTRDKQQEVLSNNSFRPLMNLIQTHNVEADDSRREFMAASSREGTANSTFFQNTPPTSSLDNSLHQLQGNALSNLNYELPSRSDLNPSLYQSDAGMAMLPPSNLALQHIIQSINTVQQGVANGYGNNQQLSNLLQDK